MFSPGEAFWNEAILLADGLCNPIVTVAAESGVNSKNSCNSRVGNCDGKLKEREGESVDKFGSVGGLLGKHEKGLEEKSPFPVKHFDFSFEDKKTDLIVVRGGDTSDIKSTTQGGGAPSELRPVDISPRNDSTNKHCGNSQRDKKECGVQEIAPPSVVNKRSVDLVSKDYQSMKYDVPIAGIRTIGNHESSEATPSSIMPSKDWLELKNWLPSEICSIYKKKGIVKLYPWQVYILMN